MLTGLSGLAWLFLSGLSPLSALSESLWKIVFPQFVPWPFCDFRRGAPAEPSPMTSPLCPRLKNMFLTFQRFLQHLL